VERFDEIDSTSLHARRMVMEQPRQCASPRVLIARRQSAGRGRLGRPWSSPDGGFWGTFIWPLASTPSANASLSVNDQQPPNQRWSLEGLGLRIGVACTRAVEDMIDAACAEGSSPLPCPLATLKWPNDVLLAGKKVLGVLTEAIARSGSIWLLVGVGVNVNLSTGSLPVELRERATTLREQLGRDVHPDCVLRAIGTRLFEALSCPCLDQESIDAARSRLAGVGQPLTVADAYGGTMRGVLLGLTDAGHPIVRGPEGYRRGADSA
jgi:BirA family transcriptional regulator, biotin operon repressor / biotin---[acetyl-CoA-carboxylase] ligase